MVTRIADIDKTKELDYASVEMMDGLKQRTTQVSGADVNIFSITTRI